MAPSAEPLKDTYVGKKWEYEGEVYAVGCVYPKPPPNMFMGKPPKKPYFGLVKENDPHYYIEPCDEFIGEAQLVPPKEEKKCDGMICRQMSGYLTEFDGGDYCPTCLLEVVTDTCEECGCRDDFESAAFVGEHVLCRSCYDKKDADEIAELEAD